jgi:polysaccharide deacetylase 2 family uncharacterized protein YibQ
MKEKDPDQKITLCQRRLFLLKGFAYLSGALLGLNIFSSAQAKETHLSPFPKPRRQRFHPSGPAPRIAFIIDDIGSSITRAKAFLSLKMPMTFAVLPKLEYSNLLAQEIFEKGYEVMLHQPMEPYDQDIDPGPGALYVSYRDDEIEEIVRENIAQMPQASGVNNHMGSRFTSCSNKVVEALKIIKQKNLFFVDSLTSRHSQAYKLARWLNIKSAPRNVFLDNSLELSDIRRQLNSLKRHALTHGEAIGIGHPHLSTLFALYDFKCELNNKGPLFELVSVSDLISA